MRSFQFWLLMLGSTLISALMIKQIFLSRALNHEQRQLIDSQAIAATASEYSNAWQTLAMHIYQSSRQDPAFAAILKEAAVDVRPTPPTGQAVGPATTVVPSTGDEGAPAPTPAPAPAPAPAKSPGTP